MVWNGHSYMYTDSVQLIPIELMDNVLSTHSQCAMKIELLQVQIVEHTSIEPTVR